MSRYNKDFTLTREDLALIEIALNSRKDELAKIATETGSAQNIEALAIYELLGRLHNQKTFFRPKNEQYISG